MIRNLYTQIQARIFMEVILRIMPFSCNAMSYEKESQLWNLKKAGVSFFHLMYKSKMVYFKRSVARYSWRNIHTLWASAVLYVSNTANNDI